jgi:hypothetical protein
MESFRLVLHRRIIADRGERKQATRGWTRCGRFLSARFCSSAMLSEVP